MSYENNQTLKEYIKGYLKSNLEIFGSFIKICKTIVCCVLSESLSAESCIVYLNGWNDNELAVPDEAVWDK